ncbi:replication initiation protein (plasmid) [Achromobacter seleniivolatilans]|uniref:Replication initiation protein n=1 Tax=Achromobacter seleniivolatilans TaxID=3047478 RepID=A0ABY9MB90_9BURK|nr:replication initiation protein [Achromobacter sp. R39]WMD24000.1 replication initiation protein [Achromobacter sp. R39]
MASSNSRARRAPKAPKGGDPSPVVQGQIVVFEGEDDDRTLKKSNDTIAVRVERGGLSSLGRKVFNVLIYHAQQLGEPGTTGPTEVRNHSKYFWIPLRDVVADTRYNSNDTDLLKQQIDELQDVRVKIEGQKQYTSERLLSSATLYNPNGLNARGGIVWLGYAFPPEISSEMLRPMQYTKLSLYYLTSLRTNGGMALYEICRRYLTNPSKLTSRQSVQWWYQVLTGNPASAEVPEYKYFKRDTLLKAIREVNDVTDLIVELIEFKEGRRVAELQFSVDRKAQEPLQLSAPAVDSAAHLARLMSLGITQADALGYIGDTDEGKLIATLELVEKRIGNKQLAPVGSPAAYFHQALRGSYAPPQDVAKVTHRDRGRTAPPEVNLQELKLRFLTARSQEAIGYVGEIDADQRNELLERFKESRAFQSLHPSAKKTLEPGRDPSPMVKTSFGMWVAHELWGEPAEQDLYAFGLREMTGAA